MSYSAEQEAFRSHVQSWIGRHVPDELRFASEHGESAERYALRRELGRALGREGWLYPRAPRRYGGGGLSLDEAIVLVEEFGALELELPPYYDSGGSLGSTAILVWGTDEQKEALLPPIYTGEQRSWQLLTEPGAGSDLAAVSTQAVRDGDDYVLTGTKVFIGSDHGCDAHWTIVRTGAPDARHQNLSWFMIDADTPGITVQPMELIGGSCKQAVYFDGARVPAERLVGGENNGWKVASTHLELEHGMRTDHLIGTRLDRAWHAAARVAQAEPSVLDDAEAVDRLVDSYVRKEAVRLLGLRNYELAMNQRPMTYEGPQAYLLEKKAQQHFADVLLDVLGAQALIDDGTRDRGVVASFQATGILAMHGGGTAEIQKLVMARRMGIGRKEAETAGRLA